MKWFAKWWAGVFAALAVPVVAGAATVDSIIAIVNQQVITRSEVLQQVDLLRRTQPQLQDAEQAALNELIDRQLQLNRAAALGMAIKDNVVEQQIDLLKRNLNLADDGALLAYAKDEFGVDSLPQLEKRINDDLIIQNVFYLEVFEKTPVYEEEIDRYLRNSDFSETLRYRLVHILLPPTQAGYEQARQVHERLLKGEDYVALSQAFSIDERNKETGVLGYIDEDNLPFAFVDELSNLEIDDVGSIIETSRGYHVIKLLGRQGGDVRREVARYRLQHVFLSLDDDARTQEAYRDLQDGRAFADVVAAYSIDERSVQSGGDLGWFEQDDVPSAFVDAVVQMEVGAFSEPLPSRFGVHIVRLADKQVQTPDIQTLRDRARALLQERRALSQRPIWLKKLRSQAYIRIVDPEWLPPDSQ